MKVGHAAAAASLFLITFAAFFDTHAQMPIIGSYALSLGATPFLIGVTVGAYSFTNIFGNGVSGVLIDRKGWRLPLFVGLGAAAFVLYMYSAVQTLASLLVVRLFHGLAGGVLVPAALAGVGSLGAKNQARRLGNFGAAIGLAALTGPPVAGVLAGRIGYSVTYQVLAGIMTAVFGVGWFLLRYHQPHQDEDRQAQTQETPSLPSDALFAAVGAFLLMAATGTVIAFLPILAQGLGFTAASTGRLFGAFALAAIVVQLVWARAPILQRFGSQQSTLLGLLVLYGALVLFALQTRPGGLIVTAVLYGCGFGLAFPNMLQLVMTDPKNRGRHIGLFFATYSLGVALVPPMAGYLSQVFPAVSPFYAAALIGTVGMVSLKAYAPSS